MAGKGEEDGDFRHGYGLEEISDYDLATYQRKEKTRYPETFGSQIYEFRIAYLEIDMDGFLDGFIAVCDKDGCKYR